MSDVYPVSEIFHSVQGEGRWTGTPMMFVRLAGCNVGKYAPAIWKPEKPDQIEQLQIFHPQHSICTTFDGQRFLCDTDYHPLLGKMTAEAIAAELHQEDHVCITGGEPFLHDLAPLIRTIYDSKPEGIGMFHIETSGTLPISFKGDLRPTELWITCCPKRVEAVQLVGDIFNEVDEWKILVGHDFCEHTLQKIDSQIPWTNDERYLQPINGVHDVWQANLARCLDLLKRWPHWKLSAQLHKYLGVR